MKQLHASANTDLSGVAEQQVREQVNRIIHSKAFRNAPALQRLLQYVTAKAADGLADQLKEYTIGVEALNRGADYDPKVDTVVRVEVHRLRQKLGEYYEVEGVGDPVAIDIPKGQYLPIFGVRTTGASGASDAPNKTVSSSPTKEQIKPEVGSVLFESQSYASRVRPFWSRRAAIALAAMGLFLFGWIVGARSERTLIRSKGDTSSTRLEPSVARSGDVVHDFWSSFLGNDVAPVVGYADAVFLIDETNDLFRFRRGASDDRGSPVDSHLARQFASNPDLVGRAGPLFYEDGYSGTGDVESVFKLTRLFTQMGYQITVKRCRLVTIDDLRDHNVILLGSSFQNETVAQLPLAVDFVFDTPDINHELWNGRIVNLHPLAGESPAFKTERDPITRAVKADYGLITVQPGIVPGRYIAILGALDTSGVVGATEFVTSTSGLGEVMRRLEPLGEKIERARPPFFQALVKVDLAKGHDVLGVRLVTAHVVRPKAKEANTLRSNGPVSGSP